MTPKRGAVQGARIVQSVQVPAFFYGTAWKEERTAPLIRLALDAGFRAIDTANQRKHYFEAAVGEGIARFMDEGKGTREDLFLQTKFTHVDGQDHRLPYDRRAPPGEQVMQSLASSLEHLHVSYVDSYLLHGPSLPDRLSDEDWQILRSMHELKRAGKTRLVGVSNVSLSQVAELCRDDQTKPAFVQNRCYARAGWDRSIRTLCHEQGVLYQGFSLLTANRAALESPVVGRIAARVQKTVAQVVFRFALAVGMIPLTGTSSAEHMQEDLEVSGFALSDDDVAAMEDIGLRRNDKP